MVKRSYKLVDGASLAEHARRLKARAGWDPSSLNASRAHVIEAALSDVRVAQQLEKATRCADCDAARHSQKDDTALCAQHLALAMGVTKKL